MTLKYLQPSTNNAALADPSVFGLIVRSIRLRVIGTGQLTWDVVMPSVNEGDVPPTVYTQRRTPRIGIGGTSVVPVAVMRGADQMRFHVVPLS